MLKAHPAKHRYGTIATNLFHGRRRFHAWFESMYTIWLDNEDHDWVIDAEPTNGQIQMAHKGRTWYEIDVQGHTAHASTPWKGADAIAAMSEIICEIRHAILYFTPVHPDGGKFYSYFRSDHRRLSSLCCTGSLPKYGLTCVWFRH
ncbi:MAG: peptidase dimerization domain-containing protein [Eubacterium ramulus]